MKMVHGNFRKYPRTFKKNTKIEKQERILDIGVGTAAGILAFTFINGLGLGYLLKKKLSDC